MPGPYNVYCDESCHLEKDRKPVMVLGALWCPADRVRTIGDDIRGLKIAHGLPRDFEIKWTKVGAGQRAFYESLVDYYVGSRDLRFRGLVATEKRLLDHEAFHQDHDAWYWKMYFRLLKGLATRPGPFRVYVDIKDTRSADRIRLLTDIITNQLRSEGGGNIDRIQTIRSHESEILQLSDLLIGAVSFANRPAEPNRTSQMKFDLVDRLERGTCHRLTESTPLSAGKFNLFVWTPQSR